MPCHVSKRASFFLVIAICLNLLCINVGWLYFLKHHHFTNQGQIRSASPPTSRPHRPPPTASPARYLLNTSTCRLPAWPVLEHETRHFHRPNASATIKCPPHNGVIHIRRLNFTWIQISTNGQLPPHCYAHEIATDAKDYVALLPRRLKLGSLTNLANNQTRNRTAPSWDSALVICRFGGKKYKKIVPLVQDYGWKVSREVSGKYSGKKYGKYSGKNQSQVNVILFGIDSLSRLNFLRYFPKTRAFLRSKKFQALYGHHKTGLNTFPNVISLLTGRLLWAFCSSDNGNCGRGFKFDDVPLIFKEFRRRGYLTSLLEDDPIYGIFHWNHYASADPPGGFAVPPVDYYFRPSELSIYEKVKRRCYQDEPEIDVYLAYLADLFDAFKERDQSFFSVSHLSRITHDISKSARYLDLPLSKFLDRLSTSGHLANTLVLLYADHALRYGGATNTTVNVREQRLPLFYGFIPDTLSVDGQSAAKLRRVFKTNAHRLTSHLDLHATMMHILTGNGSASAGGSPGRSLFREIPEDRTCTSAGIPPEYCLCNELTPLEIERWPNQIDDYTTLALEHLNRVQASFGNFCVPFSSGNAYRAYSTFSPDLNATLVFLYIQVQPSGAHLEVMLRLAPAEAEGKDQTGDKLPQAAQVLFYTRTDKYDDESHCVAERRELMEICLCWDIYLQRRGEFTIGKFYQWLTH